MKVKIVDVGSAKRITCNEAKKGDPYDLICIERRIHEPIGACYIASALAKAGHEVSVFSPDSEEISIQEILASQPEVVGFSALTYNYQLTLRVAQALKCIRPEIITILGGYHATCLQREISNESAFDFVVAREGDLAIVDLLECLKGRREWRNIRGEVYWKEGSCSNFQRLNPNTNPIPFRTKAMMTGRKRFDLAYPPPSQQVAMALIVGSRGCDFGCKFCLSSEMFPASKYGTRTLYRDVGNIIKEIKLCQRDFGTNCLFFVDLNFYGGNLERIEYLCQELAKLKIGWYAMSRIDANPVIFEHMKKGGCAMIGLGIESLTKSLKSGATTDIGIWQQQVHTTIAHLNDLGILSKGYFILGDHGTTRKDLEAEKQAILELRCDIIRCSFMIYSPGSFEFCRLKVVEGFMTDNLDDFSTDGPVIKIPDMKAKEIVTFRKGIYRDFYAPERYHSQAEAMMQRFPHLRQSYMEYNEILASTLGEGFM